MSPKTIWLNTFEKATYRVALHIVFWVFLLVLAAGTIIYPLWFRAVAIGVSALAYYPLAYALIPLYRKKKLALALPATLFYVIAMALVMLLFYQALVALYMDFVGQESDLISEDTPKLGLEALYLLAGLYLAVLFLPMVAKALRELYKEQTKALTLEKENVQLELDFLKAQINPHFLFNTLNNIQSFIINNEPDKSVQLLGRLSELMRFTLYETGKDLISVSKELEIIENYVSLEQSRWEDKADIRLTINGDDDGYCIPPCILLPLVENAFKHGVSNSIRKAFVTIDIRLIEYALSMTIRNSVESNGQADLHRGSVGLANVKKRLQHFFPQDHTFFAARDNGTFVVELQINRMKPCPR